jgi:hypothetical protein
VGFQPFDNLVFDIVHGPRVGARPLLCAALASARRKAELLGDAIHIQVQKNRSCRPIMMGGLVQQCPNARNGRWTGSGSAHNDLSL